MRILLVSYHFPPFNAVGAVRPGKLASYLVRQGHEVQVLTCADQPLPASLVLEVPQSQVTYAPAWSVNAPIEWARGGRAKVAREGFSSGVTMGSTMHRLGHLYKIIFHWPDAQIGWVNSAIRAGRTHLKEHPCDLIYASGPPFSAFRVAAALSREFGLRWIAELRDLWTDNHAYAFPAWRAAIERRWEKNLLSSASGLVTISAPLVQKLHRFGKPVWEIRNGCDPEDFDGLPKPETFGRIDGGLDIVFTGNVYDGYYDVDAFCAGLRRYLAQGGRASVHVAGRNTTALRHAAAAQEVLPHFNFQSTVPRLAALSMQRYADVLLAFLWQGEHADGIYSAKLFEYAGAGRPVLAVGAASSSVGNLIETAGFGNICPDAESIAAQLLRWQAAKRGAGSLSVSCAQGHDMARRTQFSLLEKHMIASLHGKEY